MRWVSLCDDQSWFKLQAASVFRFDLYNCFRVPLNILSPIPEGTNTSGWRPLVYYPLDLQKSSRKTDGYNLWSTAVNELCGPMVSIPASFSGCSEFRSCPRDRLSWGLSLFFQSLLTNSRLMLQVRPRPLPSTSLPIPIINWTMGGKT
jgi:hypothetical protein